mmetsp:Transcript_3085/g.8945  ORF Transcript_3085/g.8945 Transcript_3085/m.8945 type:complete len:146 (+) Transcript_3085:1002-1439(+)
MWVPLALALASSAVRAKMFEASALSAPPEASVPSAETEERAWASLWIVVFAAKLALNSVHMRSDLAPSCGVHCLAHDALEHPENAGIGGPSLDPEGLDLPSGLPRAHTSGQWLRHGSTRGKPASQTAASVEEDSGRAGKFEGHAA